MRRGLLLAGVTVVLAALSGSAQNSVIVESKDVLPFSTGVKTGVFLENDVPWLGVDMPLEFREIDSKAFIADSVRISIQGRVALSGLANWTTVRWFGSPNPSSACSGPVSNSYETDSPVDFISPDAMIWHAEDFTGPPFEPGTDGWPGIGFPSLTITFNVSGSAGRFEIDTCCIAPFGHLVVLGPINDLTPSFEKGTISILDSCLCPCQGDLICDTLFDVLDVVAAVNQVFRGAPGKLDAGCPHLGRADVNCDCVENVLDVVLLVGRVFRSDQDEFCDPCVEPCRE